MGSCTDKTISIAHMAAPQHPDSGDFMYRVRQPDAAAGALPGVQCVSFTSVCTQRRRLMRDADVLVIQMIGDIDLLPVILERRSAGRLTVYEISDNLLAFQPSNPASAFYADPANRACILQLASLCHGVQFTMPELERRFAHINERRAVFMNQVTSLGNPERPDSDAVTIGWGGSLGHYHDIRRTAPHIIDFLNSNPRARLALMAAPKITDLFQDVPDHRKQLTPTGSLADYYAFLQTLDIGLAPMIAVDDFNACRSDVKFIEYASRGAVPVCSSAPPYAHTVRHGETGFLFRDFSEMRQVLDRLCADRDLMKQIRARAFDYVKTERSARADALRRVGFYRELMHAHSLECGDALRDIQNEPGAEKTQDAQHWLMRFGPVEQLLHDGLAAQFRNQDPAAAASLLDRACALAPDFYPAHLYRANLLAETKPAQAMRLLERIIKDHQEPLAAPLLAARLLASAGRMAQALKTVQALRTRSPLCAPAHALEADMHRATGNADKALACCQAALEANPWFSPAATQAGALHLDAGRHAHAERMFAKALETADHIPANHMGLAASLHLAGNTAQAAQHMLAALERDPGADPAAAFVLDVARAHFRTSQWDQAAALLERVHALRAADMDTAFWLARALDHTGNTDRATHVWRHIAAHDPGGRYGSVAEQKIAARGQQSANP